MDTNDWEVITEIKDIKMGRYNCIIYKIDSKNLIVGGKDGVYLIDIDNFKIKKKVDITKKTICLCPFSQKLFLIYDKKGIISQWKFAGNDIIKEKEREKVTDEKCFCMKYLNDGSLLLGVEKSLIILG